MVGFRPIAFRRDKMYRMRTRGKRYIRRTNLSKSMVKGKNIAFFKRTFLEEHTIQNAAWNPIEFDARDNDYRLSDVPNSTEFTNLYDQYKICGIRHKFIFEKNSSEAGSSTTNILPTLITVNDFNTASPLTDENTALQYHSCKMSRLDKVRSRYFKPTSDVTAVSSAQTASVKRQWINTAFPDYPHHGMLAAVTTSGTGTDVLGVLKVYTTYYIACKGAK